MKQISLVLCTLVLVVGATKAQTTVQSESTSWKTYTMKGEDSLMKPEPQYTLEARRKGITGIVVLKAVFSATGHVTSIRVVRGLPLGLTEQSIAVATQIRFTPALKDGKPVSMWVQLEYYFSLTND